MTASELTYFNVTGFWYDVEAPLTGGSTSTPQFEVISAFVNFIPRLPLGFTIQVSNLDIGGGTGQNVGLAIAPITGRILSGQLETIDFSDTAGVQLLANSTVISTQLAAELTALNWSTTVLVYDVQFTNVVYNEDFETLTNFAFTAPTTNTPVCLTDPTFTRLPYAGPQG
jgi:hypothetical protein